MTTELMSSLKDLDKEYGISNIPDNAYHVVLGENTKPVDGKEGKNESFRMGWKVKCGEYTGRELGDFIGWFPKSKEKESDKDAIRAARGQTVQVLKALASVITDEDQYSQAISGLRNSATPAEARGYFQQIANIARGAELYVRAHTKAAKAPGGDEFQNVRYLEKGQPISAVCACKAAAVAV